MKFHIRALIITGALLAAAAASPAAAAATPESVLTAARPVQNPVPPDDDGGSRVFTAPAAPRITDAPPDKAGASAVSPTISPSASYTFIPPNSDYTCGSGNLCTLVWDPTRSQWKLFYLYYCNFFTLYNWLGDGFYANNQTGGVYALFYNSSRQVIRSAPADSIQRTIDWDPVYYVRNC